MAESWKKKEKYPIFLFRISVEENNYIRQLKYFSPSKMFVGGKKGKSLQVRIVILYPASALNKILSAT